MLAYDAPTFSDSNSWIGVVVNCWCEVFACTSQVSTCINDVGVVVGGERLPSCDSGGSWLSATLPILTVIVRLERSAKRLRSSDRRGAIKTNRGVSLIPACCSLIHYHSIMMCLYDPVSGRFLDIEPMERCSMVYTDLYVGISTTMPGQLNCRQPSPLNSEPFRHDCWVA
jgi:hypothetical protein